MEHARWWILASGLSLSSYIQARQTSPSVNLEDKVASKNNGNIGSYESLGLRFFRTTTVFQLIRDMWEESKQIMPVLFILGGTYIFSSFKLILERKAVREIHEPSRLGFSRKISENKFTLLLANDKTAEQRDKRLSLVKKPFATSFKSHDKPFSGKVVSPVCVKYSRTFFQLFLVFRDNNLLR